MKKLVLVECSALMGHHYQPSPRLTKHSRKWWKNEEECYEMLSSEQGQPLPNLAAAWLLHKIKSVST